MKKIILALLTLSLISCAMKDDDNAVTSQDRRDFESSQKLRSEYSEIEGLYNGFVSASDREMPIEIRLIKIEVENGFNSSGQIKTLPKLKALLTFSDTLEDDVELNVSYNKDSASLIFTSVQAKAEATTPVLSINSTVNSRRDMIEGSLIKNTSLLGKFTVHLTSKTVTEITEAEKKKRLEEFYKPIEGFYQGTIAAPDRVIPVELRLTTFFVNKKNPATGADKTLPILIGKLTLLDTISDDIELYFSFDKTSKEVVFTSETAERFSFKGIFEQNQIFGDLKKNNAIYGDIKLNLVSKTFKEITESERNARLASILKMVEGSYIAKMILAGVEEKVQVDLNVVTFGKPYLVSYCRFVNYGVGEELKVNYVPHPKPDQINLSLQPGSLAKTCPFQSIDGIITGKKISAKTTDRKGTVRQLDFVRL